MDECEKTEAIRYLKQCVDSSTKTKMRNEKKHTNKVKLTSNLIKKKFALKKKLSQKTGELARVKPPVLKCKLCGETKPKKLLLLKHLETHIGTPITCIKCRRSFNSSFAFEWHFRHFCFLKRRGGERTFKCSECPKVRVISQIAATQINVQLLSRHSVTIGTCSVTLKATNGTTAPTATRS